MSAKLLSRSVLVMALCGLSCGCGTDYGWRSTVPDDRRTVYVPTFRNESTVMELGAIAARQVAREGITVNNLCPGVFFTDRNKEALGNPEYAEKVMNAIPMHDYARPEDAAGTAVLLASDAGRYITGTTILIDGGISLPG